MGNKQSAVRPCGAGVTATPTTPTLSARDVRSLHALYGHDAELLHLMVSAELLRDCAKHARDACALHFHHAFLAAKHERQFGASLVAVSERLRASSLLSDDDDDDDAARAGAVAAKDRARGRPPVAASSAPDEAATTPGKMTAAGAVPAGAASSARASRSADDEGPGRTPLGAVLATGALLGKLGAAHVGAADERAEHVGRLAERVTELARKVERNHSVKLERHAPSALAHEKAFNHMRGPRDRLESLMRLDPESRERDAAAKRIDQAEVDLRKREAQLEATTDMLKRRASVFLVTWTPKLADAFAALNFLEEEERRSAARLFGRLDADKCGCASAEAARAKARAFVADDEEEEEEERPASPPSTPTRGDESDRRAVVNAAAGVAGEDRAANTTGRAKGVAA